MDCLALWCVVTDICQCAVQQNRQKTRHLNAVGSFGDQTPMNVKATR